MKDEHLAASSRRQAMARPDAVALVAVQREWRFAEIDEASSRIAQALLKAGIGPGDRVGALTKDLSACLLLLLATSKIGAVFAPHNWRLAARELEHVLNFSETRLLVTDAEFLPLLANTRTPAVARVFLTDAVDATGFAPWYESHPAIDPGAEPAADDAALQLNSSGTTGLPKAIALSHRNLLLLAEEATAQIWRCEGAALRFLAVLPNFHVAGMANLVTVFCQGGMTLAPREFDAGRVIADIARHRIAQACFVPAMMQAIVQHPAAAVADFSTMRAITYGGSPISSTLMNAAQGLLGCELFQVYGMTESTAVSTILAPQDHRGPQMRSAGKPALGVSLRVMDMQTGHELPEGEVGEIQVRSARNMLGYFRNPEATAQAFPEGRGEDGGWYRTGDAGCLREGFLYIHDRLRDMIISGGENVYPAEVENIVAAFPGVAECAVIGVPDARWGEVVKACVVCRPGVAVDGNALIAFCREKLAHYKCPKSVDFVDTLPRNPAGKVLRRLLREPYWAEPKSSPTS